MAATLQARDARFPCYSSFSILYLFNYKFCILLSLLLLKETQVKGKFSVNDWWLMAGIKFNSHWQGVWPCQLHQCRDRWAGFHIFWSEWDILGLGHGTDTLNTVTSPCELFWVSRQYSDVYLAWHLRLGRHCYSASRPNPRKLYRAMLWSIYVPCEGESVLLSCFRGPLGIWETWWWVS